ncbi:MAG: aspartate ammonia-lyase [Deltaproteobacteria bacterium]|nr:aspartate ammonia-lyase [Deltaproteobacteria bacterium]
MRNVATTTFLSTLLLGLCAYAPAYAQGEFRVEKDLLGEKQVPAAAYYGVQTARALENFRISGQTVGQYPEFVDGLAIVKMAAARANYDVGAMKKDLRDAIDKAGEAILAGRYHDQFLVDLYQGGAGTSTNMNANEVMANVALELTGHKKGEYSVIEPHDHLNMSQSTNDAYPTALKVAILRSNDALLPPLEELAGALRAKGDAFLTIVKMGRTETQDAVPMTVGQEFHAFAAGLEAEIDLLREAERHLYAVNMGATAIGTGLNAPKGYAKACAKHLAKLTGKEIVSAPDLIAATSDLQPFVIYASALESLATKLVKIASDLILLSSGPRAGLFEIRLPALQPGSSIMPGKVNPVMPELVNLVSFRVTANSLAVTLAAQHGQLQLNAYEPLAGAAILESQMLLRNLVASFRTSCIDGIVVNEDVCAAYIERTVGIVTALNPVVGYEKATELAGEAYRSGKGILEIVREKKILTDAQIRDLLDPVKLTGLDPAIYKTKRATKGR